MNDYTSVIEEVQALLVSGYSQERIEAESGVPFTSIQAFLDEYLPPDGLRSELPINELDCLARWLAEEDEERPAGLSALVQTPTLKAMEAIFEFARQKRKIVSINGDVGIGKSVAGRGYAHDNPKTCDEPGALYVQFSATDTSTVAVLHTIYRALPGAYRAEPRRVNHMAGIRRLLRPGDLLILDECNYPGGAKSGPANVFRDIWADGSFGVVMLGNPTFTQSVWGARVAYDALISRTDRFDFPHTTQGDVDAFLLHYGIKGKARRAAAVKIAARPGPHGGLRALVKAIEAAGGPDAIDPERFTEVCYRLL